MLQTTIKYILKVATNQKAIVIVLLQNMYYAIISIIIIYAYIYISMETDRGKISFHNSIFINKIQQTQQMFANIRTAHTGTSIIP